MKKVIGCFALALVLLFNCMAVMAREDYFAGWSDNEKFLYAVESMKDAEHIEYYDEEDHAACEEAPDASEEDEEVPGLPCDRCALGSVNVVSTTYTPWIYSGATKQCNRIFSALDLEQIRQVTTTYQCNNCGYGFITNVTQSQWTCGHN